MLAREPLAPVDSAWLHMDDADNLMVVTLVLIFEQPMSYERIRQIVETRLLAHPRFRQRIAGPSARRLPFGALHWEEDPDFDIDRHVERADLQDPDEEASLHRFVSAVLSRPLDPSRPLWHLYHVDRCRGGSALVARIHHCVGDGLGLMHVFMSMADRPVPVAAVTAPTACAQRSTAPAAAVANAMTRGALAAARLVLMRRDPATDLKGPLTVEKRATWSTPVSLELVKTASRTLGVSVNDVLLAAVTGALRRYLLARDAVDDRLAVRGVVPVNLRRIEEAHLLGNRFGLVFVSMPVGLADPEQRLAEVRRRMHALKRSLEPFVTFQVLRALGVAPRTIFDFVVGMFGRKATAIVTNVIGPGEMVSYGGVRLREVMFWVPCAGKLGVGISVLSYAGRVSVGFATDAGLIPDPQQIVAGFDAELAHLFERARVGTRAPEEVFATAG